MWNPHILTAGEMVLTTYKVVVLFRDRPAFQSGPRPQESPSSCTALQLRKRNLYSGKKDTQVALYTIPLRLTHPTATAAVNNSMLLYIARNQFPVDISMLASLSL